MKAARAWVQRLLGATGKIPKASSKAYSETRRIRSVHYGSIRKIFRRSLESNNRLCLCSFMSAEYDDLPDEVTAEVQTFSDVNVAWISKAVVAADVARPDNSQARARAIFAAVAGAQLMARSRSDISLFDALIESYRATGLLPA